MTRSIQTVEQATESLNLPEVLDALIQTGDLGELTPQQRVVYYRGICEHLGLDPLTRPFQYLQLPTKDDDGNRGTKLILYADKGCAEQLRRQYKVSITELERSTAVPGAYIVVAHARLPDGRTDMATGAVGITWKTGPMTGDPLGNQIMRAETKAKRRVTLSLLGLGMLDESEVDSIPGAVRVTVEEADRLSPVPEQRQIPAPAPKPDKRPMPQSMAIPTKEKPEAGKDPLASEAHLKALLGDAERRWEWNESALSDYCRSLHDGRRLDELTVSEANDLLKRLKGAAPELERYDESGVGVYREAVTAS